MRTVSARLQRRIARDFPSPGSAEEVIRALAGVSDSDRVQAAILFAANGRFARPNHAVEDPATSQITLSEPVVVPTALEGPGVDLRSTWPGQVVDLRFSAEGGSLISEYAVPQAAQPGYARGVATLVGPSGEVVPNFGSLARQGGNWRLPSSGEYTLRLTPSGADRVDRLDQSVLLGQEVSATLDGAPGAPVTRPTGSGGMGERDRAGRAPRGLPAHR